MDIALINALLNYADALMHPVLLAIFLSTTAFVIAVYTLLTKGEAK